jgi:group I intron endonuclease
MGFIYKITNINNNKLYIGQTSKDNPDKRWKEHKYSFKFGNGCPILQNAVNKEGIENFKFEIIIICFNEDLCKYEKEYIKKYKSLTPNGYNANEGGEPGGMFKDHHHSEETKKILSEKLKSYYSNNSIIRKAHGSKISSVLKVSEKWREYLKRDRSTKGASLSNERKEQIRNSINNYYKNNEDTAKQKISESMIKSVGRSIQQFTLTGEFIETFSCIAEAGRQTPVNRKSIQANLSGRSKTAGGFIWRYLKSV